jgi:hypothetical protein
MPSPRAVTSGIIGAQHHDARRTWGTHTGGHMQKIKLFANYSIPVVWGVVGLVIGCVGVYFPLSTMWEHVIVKPENVTATDGLTVIILSVIAGVFVGSAALFGSAQRRWTLKH